MTRGDHEWTLSQAVLAQRVQDVADVCHRCQTMPPVRIDGQWFHLLEQTTGLGVVCRAAAIHERQWQDERKVTA